VPATPESAVHVHSVQEEYFYLMVHHCACGGPWLTESQHVEESGAHPHHRLQAHCFKCRARRTFLFAIDSQADSKVPVRQVNPTAEPSRALGAVQWMDLAQFYLGRIERLKEAVEKAQSLLDARQCIEEALKFYPSRASPSGASGSNDGSSDGPGDDAPPATALWSDASRKKAREQPETFRRAALAAMLEKIPPMDRLRQADKMEQREFEKGVRALAKRRVGKWWQFWRLFRRRK
jgi:hypothetical protein